jgi:hypothetical protein
MLSQLLWRFTAGTTGFCLTMTGQKVQFKSSKLSTNSVYFTSAGATALGLDSNLNSRKKKHTPASKQRKLWKKKSITKAFIRFLMSRTKSLYLLPFLRRFKRANWNWNNSRSLSLNPRPYKKWLSAHKFYLTTSTSRGTRKIDRSSKNSFFLLMPLIGIFHTSQT